MSSSAPPGWYPDRSGEGAGLRYWTGSQWTSHTRPFPTPAAPVQAGRRRLHPVVAGVLGAFVGWLTIGVILGMVFTALVPTAEMAALGALLGMVIGAVLGARWAQKAQ